MLSMLQTFLTRANELARIGLLAMLLLTFGPLVGQISAASHQAAMADWVCGDEVATSAMSHGHHGADHNHAWYEQCEYCSLVQHFPFLSVYTPQFTAANSLVEAGPVVPVRSAFRNKALFAHAPNRAPPALIS
ncbi:Protein of unknown function (DUF2946) [Marinomonas fungiae]|uniref:DUF2946 domain-containing protein n=2 Tax=Marinomonas fungiae TaxID=1137284 RepID=A0A0K6IPL4_9GAMM|nr:Protein of unknown function (DUF2946) [Marinomonas fungiae]